MVYFIVIVKKILLGNGNSPIKDPINKMNVVKLGHKVVLLSDFCFVSLTPVDPDQGDAWKYLKKCLIKG